MNSRRRRANDFTDSLNSFRQTIYEENSIISQRDLEDNSDINSIRSSGSDKHSHLSSNKSRAGSIIISGNLGNQQSISSDLYKIAGDNYNIKSNNNESLLGGILNVSDATSYLSLKPDLNKCIDLFHNEHLSKEHYTSEDYSNLGSVLSEIKVQKDMDSRRLNKNKTVEIQCNLIRNRPCAMSLNSLEDAINKHTSIKNQDVTNKELRKCKSCSMLNSNLKGNTNHNIKASYFFVAPTNTATRKSSFEKIDTATLFDALSSKPILSNKINDSHSTEADQKYDSTKSDTSSKEQLHSFELKTFLQSLDQMPLKETATQEHLLRRLSANFYNSPKTFTEKLLTIIEESVINDSCAQLEYPEVSLCRLTEELRKMCKFIEDETIPEWPESPMSTSICARQRSQGSSPLRKSLNAFASRNKSLYFAINASPRCNIKSPKKVCQHTPKNILYNAKSSLHDSTSTFESLEAFCEKLYANDNKVPIREKKPQSPLQNMDSILHVCENQMASLENSPDIREQLKKAATFTSDLASQCNNKVPEAQNLQYRLLTHKKHNKTDLKKVPDTFKEWTGHNKSYEMIEPDDLENTLMYEIAKKRQRCLDTAKVIMEIDTNSKPIETQQICPNSNKSSLTSDTKFMKTLMSVKRYQEYLEEHKSILNLFQTKSCNSPIADKKDVRKKEIFKEDFSSRPLGDKAKIATLEVPKFSGIRKKSRSPSPAKCSTNKIIVAKPKLFVTPRKTPVNKICKPKRTYFPDLVVGTNKEKKYNISPKKSTYRQIENYDHVVSPVGMYIKGTDPHLMKNLRPKTDEKLLTPRKKQITQSPSPKPKMKFRLSPKQPKKTMIRTVVGDENMPDNFLHPKVHYKLPSHVRTIKEKESHKVGNRINELLRSTQDKVVIRHEGRIKSVQTDCLKQPEIHYDSAEESVHIEQTARKTYFSRVQKH